MTDTVPCNFINNARVVNGIAANGFYVETTSTDDWVKVDIGFYSSRQKIIPIGADVDVSYDHTSELTSKTNHGTIYDGETVDFNYRVTDEVFIRSNSAGSPATVRIFAW